MARVEDEFFLFSLLCFQVFPIFPATSLLPSSRTAFCLDKPVSTVALHCLSSRHSVGAHASIVLLLLIVLQLHQLHSACFPFREAAVFHALSAAEAVTLHNWRSSRVTLQSSVLAATAAVVSDLFGLL